jgi:hypothetical protein
MEERKLVCFLYYPSNKSNVKIIWFSKNVAATRRWDLNGYSYFHWRYFKLHIIVAFDGLLLSLASWFLMLSTNCIQVTFFIFGKKKIVANNFVQSHRVKFVERLAGKHALFLSEV